MTTKTTRTPGPWSNSTMDQRERIRIVRDWTERYIYTLTPETVDAVADMMERHDGDEDAFDLDAAIDKATGA